MEATYVERAIQTEPPRQLSRSDDAKALNLHEPLPVDHTAYTQLSSLSITKREHKLSQLTYQKPSEPNLTAKRIVSLPETSPPSRIKADTIRDRVVSMSEQVKVSLTSADNSLSSDCLESSIDTSQSQISSDTGNVSTRKSRARRSLVFPQTPSPPSSPESIMIIGNNMQVPSSFLRQKAFKLKSLDDDEGWITWASSPPRPIPALHGPLSLPYARCPSGAEGTIIEGDDMTRTIWGLGNDSGHTQREHGVPQFGQPLSVSKPEPLVRPELPTRFRSLSSTPLEPAEQSNIFRKPVSGDRLYIDDPRHLQQLSGNMERPVFGLGLAWNGTQTPSSKALDLAGTQPHLKASAPEFVPSARLSQQPQPRVSLVNPPVRSHYIIPKPQMPAIDLAYEYRAQQEGKTPQLSSSSSTSPAWSPYLPSPLPLSSDMSPDVWNSEDAADELRRFIYERIGQQNLSPSDLKQISELARSMNLDRTPYDRHFSTPKFTPASPTLNIDLHHPGPPPNKPLPPIPSQRSGMTPLSPNSSVTSRVGGRPDAQPRSVPFARLLQRRLSVVPEESTDHLSTLTRTERPAFGASADAQHYKPYFAQTTGQKARHPNVSNQIRTGEMHHSHSSGSGVEPFTAGNLEVGDYVQLGPRISANSANTGVHTTKGPKALPPNGGFRESRGRPNKLKNTVGTALDSPDAIPRHKENVLATDRSGSVDSNRSGNILATVARKEAGRKRSKAKPRKQEINDPVGSTSEPGSLEPPIGDAWLCGPALEAWRA